VIDCPSGIGHWLEAGLGYKVTIGRRSAAGIGDMAGGLAVECKRRIGDGKFTSCASKIYNDKNCCNINTPS